MSDRVLDLTLEKGRLHLDQKRLVLDCDQRRLFTIPVSDLAAVLISSRNLTVTPATLVELAATGASVVICDRFYRPAVVMWPCEAHHLQSERLRIQIETTKPRRKQLWKQIVRAKIRAQAWALETMRLEAGRLVEMARKVRSGDPDNLEARAARWYWPRIFSDSNFRRRTDGDSKNSLLNYGYAIIRGAVGRGICASGLNPSIGLHHHNRYNTFCLVDDLMEPFRPMADLIVARFENQGFEDDELTPEAKRYIVEELAGRWPTRGERRTLFDLAVRAAKSLVRALEDRGERLDFPDFE